MKECPFCGSKMLTLKSKFSAWDETDRELHIICQDCACSAPVYIWNKRTFEKSAASLQKA